jgi:catechol 2,3-dioxygenase-like lactoylglutathione lyase family enzyme
MLRGMATVAFWADDLDATVAWYTELLGIEPYYRFPPEGPAAYIEFRLGDYQDELGFIDRKYAPADAATVPGGAVIHWHVDDVEAALERLLSMGAKEYLPLTKRGSGFVDAAVVDPFGNVLGIMYNPHYLEILGEQPPR